MMAWASAQVALIVIVSVGLLGGAFDVTGWPTAELVAMANKAEIVVSLNMDRP
jgi:hypothetical protein